MNKKSSIIGLMVATGLLSGCTVTVSGVPNESNRLHIVGSEYVGTAKHKTAGGIEVDDDMAISTTMGTVLSDVEDESDSKSSNNNADEAENKPVSPSTDFKKDEDKPIEDTSSESSVPREEGVFYTDFGLKAVKKEAGKYIVQQNYYYTSGSLVKMTLTFYPLANFNPDDISAYTSGGYTVDDAVKQSDGTYFIVNTDEVTLAALSMIDMDSMYEMLKYAFDEEQAAN